MQPQFDAIGPHLCRLIGNFVHEPIGACIAVSVQGRFGFRHDGNGSRRRNTGQFEQQAGSLRRGDHRMRPPVDETRISPPEIHVPERQVHAHHRLAGENMHVESGQYQQLIRFVHTPVEDGRADQVRRQRSRFCRTPQPCQQVC